MCRYVDLYALRVFPAETWLTVYRRLRDLTIWKPPGDIQIQFSWNEAWFFYMVRSTLLCFSDFHLHRVGQIWLGAVFGTGAGLFLIQLIPSIWIISSIQNCFILDADSEKGNGIARFDLDWEIWAGHPTGHYDTRAGRSEFSQIIILSIWKPPGDIQLQFSFAICSTDILNN